MQWHGKEKHFFLRVTTRRSRRRNIFRINKDLSSSNDFFTMQKAFSKTFCMSQTQAQIPQQQVRTFMLTSSHSTSRSNMAVPPSSTKQNIPEEDFEKLKNFLLDPIKEEPQVSEMKQKIRHLMQHHVYPTMPGQEAAVLVMIADAMDDYPFVIEVYHELRHHSVPHSPMTLELTAYACAQTGEWQLASEVVENMHHAVDLMHPSYDIYENAILACHQAKKWMKAMRLLEEMRIYELELSAELFLKVLEICIECGEITATLRVLNDFKMFCHEKENQKLTKYMKLLLEIAIKSKDPQHIMFLHKYMIEEKIPLPLMDPNFYQRILNLCIEQHAFSEARNLLYILNGKKKNYRNYFSLWKIYGYCI
jgi:ferritin